ncbi:hypothetical protein LCGC14_1624660 [marine sediment metagenome]|uniref:Uncharacterized protein n=1 Tax=marine sediment metagenome TaxID=412755 RepID=A0A0F9IRK2_9ZZZZ
MLEKYREVVEEWLTIIDRCANETVWQACRLPQKWEDGYCKDRECNTCLADKILSLMPKVLSESINEARITDEDGNLVAFILIGDTHIHFASGIKRAWHKSIRKDAPRQEIEKLFQEVMLRARRILEGEK